jgi:uncharacterized protein with HEPN domain
MTGNTAETIVDEAWYQNRYLKSSHNRMCVVRIGLACKLIREHYHELYRGMTFQERATMAGTIAHKVYMIEKYLAKEKTK